MQQNAVINTSQLVASDQQSQFARGWYIIADSTELAIGDVKPLRYFAKDFVLFRTESGTPVLLDAFCPHLGAHLGFGGKVVAENIECPFHAWQFDHTGSCSAIPYAKHMPPRAKTTSYPLKECNGVIFIWYDEDGQGPDFEIPILEEYNRSDWFPWKIEQITIKTQPREVLENVADVAHFEFVHNIKAVTSFENIYQDHTARQIMKGDSNLGSMTSDATYFGPGYQVTEMDAVFETRLLNANTPIDEHTIVLWFGVMMKKMDIQEDIRQALSTAYEKEIPKQLDDATARLIMDMYCARTRDGYYEDVQIWEHKQFREKPTFCDGDGPIHKLRKWYEQFFSLRKPA